MAVISRSIPVKALTPDSHGLIQDGPTARRQFIDWGAFHENPEFFAQWKHFRRALAQRNQSLRNGSPEAEITSWNEEFANAGSWIDQCRAQYLQQLITYFEPLLAQLTQEFHVTLGYKRGFLSRGQQKLVVYALHLAQLEVLHQDAERRAIVLCDDLASELDSENLARVLTTLASRPTQVFVAGTEPLEQATNFELADGVLRTV